MRKLSLVFLLVAATAALADDGLQRCRAIKDSGARLACYDALPIAPAAPASAAPAAKGEGASAAQRASQPAARTPEQFGLEYKQAQAQEQELQAIESYIPGHFEGWKANSSIRLANGQVWKIADGSEHRFYNLDNPKVVIRRGALGSFQMEIANENWVPKVRRVQ